MFLSFIKPRVWALLGGSGDQTAQVVYPALPDQTVAKFLEPLFVAIDGLFSLIFFLLFDVVYYLLSEPLGVDFEFPSCPSDLQK